MARTNEIEAAIKEFDWNVWAIAEALVDTREEMDEKVTDLEKEIADHVCETPSQ